MHTPLLHRRATMAALLCLALAPLAASAQTDYPSKPITLVNGARSQDELYHHAEFEQLADKHPNFSYVAALSGEAEDSGWTGARGFVHDAAKAHFANDFRGHKAYLCGPPLMIDACISTLMQGRLFERDIYTEKFISAADAQQVRSPLFKKI